MPSLRTLGTTILLAASVTAHALSRVPGTQTYWSYSTDKITDLNKSFVALYEVNDTVGDTSLIVRCSNYSDPTIWMYLQSKYELVNLGTTNSDGLPEVIARLGADPAFSLPVEALATITTTNGSTDTSAIGIKGQTVQRMINGLNAGKRLVLRINREMGGQPLTYTFSSNGFSEAWTNVRGCLQGRPSAAPSSPVTITPPARTTAPNGAAPKFTQWYFTGCRDATTGTRRNVLVAGNAALCDLTIETIPNGARVASADFRYELEFREGGRSGTLALDTTDYWPSSSGVKTSFNASGSKLNFTLPLNVRWRTDRVYTSINVTATVYFDNGSSKRVFEKLPVSQF